MLKNLKELIKRIKNDNRGSAIVLVIVALAMVGILAVTIMWMSMTNYNMKATDKGNKQGFYTSETVLEQIKAGLEEDASWAAARAYAYILTKDYSATSMADRDYEFKKEYQNYFVKKVADSTDTSKYNLSHLHAFIDPAAGVQLGSVSAGTLTIKQLSSTSGCKFVHSYSSDLMKLEGIHLEYTDVDSVGGEYVSKIDTDIIIMVPDVSFTQTAILPNVFEYALIADTEITNTIVGAGDAINGNFYAGDKGINLLNNLTVSGANMMISKGDVKIGTDPLSKPYTKLVLRGEPGGANSELWANDITLGKGTEFNANKIDAYIADDLSLSGKKAKVVMTGSGSYYGYGNSDSEAAKSSALVINGIGSEVDMDSLSKVVLLGRTFISVPSVDAVTLSANTKDFAMGESLAVKGEQVAFLVPDICLSYVDTISNDVVPMSNPYIKSLYPADKDGDGTPDHRIEVNLSSLSSYVSMNGFSPVYPAGSDLAYIYMQMSGDRANEYYKTYYKNNLDKLDNYFLVYAGTGKIELPAGSNVSADANFLTALKDDSTVVSGNIVKNKNSQLYIANLESGVDAGRSDEMNNEYTTKKEYLCAKLVKQGLSPTELANKLYDNLILSDNVISLIDLNDRVNHTRVDFTANSGGSDYKAVFAKNDPTANTPFPYNDPSIKVLVVDGDVEVNADFTGLMIASGTVKINGGHTITSIVNADTTQMQALKDVLQKKETKWYKPSLSAGAIETEEERSALQYFRDGSGYDLDGLQNNGSSTVSNNSVDFAEIVKFNNWVKK